MDNLALPNSTELKTFWSRPEGKTATLVLAGIVGTTVWFWKVVADFAVALLVDAVHMVYLAGILAAIAYLLLGKRPRLMFRVLMRSLTSVFVSVYPIDIIQDKLQQMKKRRDKMNEQIALVKGSVTKLERTIAQNHADAVKGFGMAQQAQKMAGAAQDQTEQLRMQLAMKQQARRAQRREQSNIGYTKLLERLQKVYSFLSRYAANVDFYIEDTQDEIEQKKTEYQTTMAASGAMKQAMAVIKGNATEEDIYDQAFDYIEQSVSTQLGVMDDLQRISQGFMDGMDIETGSVDEAALQALNSFEQKTLTSGNSDLKLVTSTPTGNTAPVPVLANQKYSVTHSDYDDLLK